MGKSNSPGNGRGSGAVVDFRLPRNGLSRRWMLLRPWQQMSLMIGAGLLLGIIAAYLMTGSGPTTAVQRPPSLPRVDVTITEEQLQAERKKWLEEYLANHPSQGVTNEGHAEQLQETIDQLRQQLDQAHSQNQADPANPATPDPGLGDQINELEAKLAEKEAELEKFKEETKEQPANRIRPEVFQYIVNRAKQFEMEELDAARRRILWWFDEQVKVGTFPWTTPVRPSFALHERSNPVYMGDFPCVGFPDDGVASAELNVEANLASGETRSEIQQPLMHYSEHPALVRAAIEAAVRNGSVPGVPSMEMVDTARIGLLDSCCNRVFYVMHAVLGAFVAVRVPLHPSTGAAAPGATDSAAIESYVDTEHRLLVYSRPWNLLPSVVPLTANSQVEHLLNPYLLADALGSPLEAAGKIAEEEQQAEEDQGRQRPDGTRLAAEEAAVGMRLLAEVPAVQSVEPSPRVLEVILPFRSRYLPTLPTLIKSIGNAHRAAGARIRLVVVPVETHTSDEADVTQRVQHALAAAAVAFDMKIDWAAPAAATEPSTPTAALEAVKGWAGPLFAQATLPAGADDSGDAATLAKNEYMRAIWAGLRATEPESTVLILDSSTILVPPTLPQQVLWRVLPNRLAFSPIASEDASTTDDMIYLDTGGLDLPAATADRHDYNETAWWLGEALVDDGSSTDSGDNPAASRRHLRLRHSRVLARSEGSQLTPSFDSLSGATPATAGSTFDDTSVWDDAAASTAGEEWLLPHPSGSDDPTFNSAGGAAIQSLQADDVTFLAAKRGNLIAAFLRSLRTAAEGGTMNDADRARALESESSGSGDPLAWSNPIIGDDCVLRSAITSMHSLTPRMVVPRFRIAGLTVEHRDSEVQGIVPPETLQCPNVGIGSAPLRLAHGTADDSFDDRRVNCAITTLTLQANLPVGQLESAEEHESEHGGVAEPKTSISDQLRYARYREVVLSTHSVRLTDPTYGMHIFAKVVPRPRGGGKAETGPIDGKIQSVVGLKAEAFRFSFSLSDQVMTSDQEVAPREDDNGA